MNRFLYEDVVLLYYIGTGVTGVVFAYIPQEWLHSYLLLVVFDLLAFSFTLFPSGHRSLLYVHMSTVVTNNFIGAVVISCITLKSYYIASRFLLYLDILCPMKLTSQVVDPFMLDPV
jgi:hypothetical protein